MDVILRSAAIYLFLLVLLRLSGKRTMSQLTALDFVLLLIVSEAAQQAILGDDRSVIGGALAILTILTVDRVSDTLTWRFGPLDKVVNDRAVVIIEHGELHADRMRMFRLSEDDMLEHARRSGLERLDQVKYAVLERTGSISIVPEPEAD